MISRVRRTTTCIDCSLGWFEDRLKDFLSCEDLSDVLICLVEYELHECVVVFMQY